MNMPPDTHETEDNAHEFDSERRSNKRRVLYDRRQQEYRRRLMMRILPVVIAVFASGLISWGAYVTHLTYNIAATYDTVFSTHIEEQAKKEIEDNLHFVVIQKEFSEKMLTLRSEMKQGMDEIRNGFRDIYLLLISQGRRLPAPPTAEPAPPKSDLKTIPDK
jgi:hypothetical protein